MHRRGFIQIVATALSAVGCKLKTSPVSSTFDAGGDVDEFDYIVVGSGAGGGPLAVNLSKAGFKVLVLEAGRDDGRREVYRIPAFHTKSTEDNDMAWNFFVDHYSDKNQQIKDAKFHRPKGGILYPRAGTLGGCTAHNAMINVYPLRKDWDRLGKEIGDPSYNHRTMRKYYQLVEKAEGNFTNERSRKLGWLPINLAPVTLILGDWGVISMLYAAAKEGTVGNFLSRPIKTVKSLLDLLKNTDTNIDVPERDTTESLVMVPLATTKGSRFSTRDHLKNNESPNLIIRTGCFVTKVLFDESGSEIMATGVEYTKGEKIYGASISPQPGDNNKHTAKARREVILAGGTFNTPQLLMLSGVGPKDELEKLASEKGVSDFKVYKDLPGVGKNLQDRYEVGVVAQARKPLPIVKNCDFKVNMTDKCYADWKEGKGPYISNGAVVGILKKSSPELENPDLFIFLLPSNFPGYVPQYSDAQGKERDKVTWAILKSHTHNQSGYVKLRSFNPLETPEINFKYFHEGNDKNGKLFADKSKAKIDDLEAVVNGVEYVRKIIKTSDHFIDKTSINPADLIEPIVGRVPYFKEVLPGPKVESRNEVREWVRNNAWGHHASCTCKMGKADDPMAVVDNKFRVFGTKNLRIVDASVFPSIPGFFIVSSIYTMSERASDEILADAGKTRRINV